MMDKLIPTSSIRNNLWVHILLWLIILQLLFDISGLYYAFRELFFEGMQHVDEAFILIPLIISLFYINSFYLIPQFFHKKTWWKYCLGLVFFFLLTLFSGILVYKFVVHRGYYFRIDFRDFEDSIIILNLVTIGISSSLGLSKIAFRNDALQKEALAKQKDAELKFLNAQVNPHFLFNTLNSIYALSTEEEAKKTTTAILKLSEIMRYPLRDGTKKKVFLSEEIEFLSNYIALQKLRLGEEYPIDFSINGKIEGVEIAPLLFIPFIENAFKYGVSQSKPQPISITFVCQNQNLTFRCINEVVKSENISSHKLGIENVRQRLELIHEGNFELATELQRNRFHVELNIAV